MQRKIRLINYILTENFAKMYKTLRLPKFRDRVTHKDSQSLQSVIV